MAKQKHALQKHALNDDIDTETRLELYRLQIEIRDAEKRAYDLFLQNLIKGTSHLSLGQEAIAAAFGVAMQKNDKSFCTYRGHAHTLARGVPVEVLDVRDEHAARLYERLLVLLRPDQHVAWRGDSEPADPVAVIDRVRGAG